MSKEIQLVVGLGNPGRKFALTRHNLGFMVIDAVVASLELPQAEHLKIYDVWKWNNEFGTTLFVKPTTFMNKSGEAVAELVRFFKIADASITVIHDDIDLEFGTVRLREGGSSGGHNGVASIQQELGYDHFRRIRVGVNRPPDRIAAESYVLMNFSESEEKEVIKIVDEVSKIVLELCTRKREFSEETIHVA